jgi:hypothetical protein
MIRVIAMFGLGPPVVSWQLRPRWVRVAAAAMARMQAQRLRPLRVGRTCTDFTDGVTVNGVFLQRESWIRPKARRGIGIRLMRYGPRAAAQLIGASIAAVAQVSIW